VAATCIRRGAKLGKVKAIHRVPDIHAGGQGNINVLASRSVEIGNNNRGKREHNADRGCSPENTHYESRPAREGTEGRI
jgi:hypothetical protein